MNMFKKLEDVVLYLYEGFARIFSPSKDIYPATGESPFEGTPYKGSGWDD
jgi:hypothetical protein